MARISYTEGYSDKSVIKQIWDLKKGKQDKLTAGENITITDDGVISSTGSDVTKAYVDQQVATRQPVGDYATRSEVNAGLAGKQPLGDYATKSELTTGLAGKQDIGDYATRSELAGGLAGKQNMLTAGENITIVGDVISASGGGTSEYYAGTGISINQNSRTITNTAIPDVDKAYVDAQIADVEADIPDVSGLATKTELTQGLAGKQPVGDYATNTRVDQVEADIPDVSNLATKAEVQAVEAQIPDVSGLASITYVDNEIDGVEAQIPDVSGLATKTEVTTGLAGKQDTLVSGTNIKTINGTSVLGSGDITVGGSSVTVGNGLGKTGDMIYDLSNVQGTVFRIGYDQGAMTYERFNPATSSWGNITLETMAYLIDLYGANATYDLRLQWNTSEVEPAVEGEALDYMGRTEGSGAVKDFMFARMDADGNWAGVVLHDGATTTPRYSWVQATFPDTSTLATKTELSTGLATKQDTLVSGTNIKTINNESILGSGDLAVEGVPDTTGASAGDVLTFDGTDVGWAAGGGSAPTNMVTTDTEQTISAVKTFSGDGGNYDVANFIILKAAAISSTPSIKFGYLYNPAGAYGCSIASTGQLANATTKSNAMRIVCTSRVSDYTKPKRTYQFFAPSSVDIGGAVDQYVEVMHSGMIPKATFTTNVGAGEKTYTVSHSLGAIPGIVQVTNSSGVVINDVTITKTSTNVTVRFDTLPGSNDTYTVAMLY